MAYSTTASLVAVCGGMSSLLDIAKDTGFNLDLELIALAQAAADGEIDSRARKQFGSVLPFGSNLPFLAVPDIIRVMASEETVRRLRSWSRVPQPVEDPEKRRQYEVLLDKLEAGQLLPGPEDTYPIGDGGGTPCAVERTPDDVLAFHFGRTSLRGFR